MSSWVRMDSFRNHAISIVTVQSRPAAQPLLPNKVAPPEINGPECRSGFYYS